MRNTRVWERACGLQRTVVEGVDFDEAAQAVVVSVRPNAKARGRCGRCARRSPCYDRGEGRRRWRALDLGTTKVFLEAAAPRVRCRTHGPTVAAVPWARHDAGHTRDFDDLAAWLAVRTSKSAVCQLLRIAWRTVGAIVTRVNADVEVKVDRLEGLRRIGIDEISYKRGHHYLIVVVNHDTGALVWAGPGRNDAALNVFFDELGPERAGLLTHVSADMADWIARVVKKRAPNAVRCNDVLTIKALEPEDARATDSRVAGPTALLIAKAHKIQDRLEQSARPDRLIDKDASDVYRLMLTTPAERINEVAATLSDDSRIAGPAQRGLELLRARFGARRAPGVEMAVRALRLGVPEDRIRTVCVTFIAALS